MSKSLKIGAAVTTLLAVLSPFVPSSAWGASYVVNRDNVLEIKLEVPDSAVALGSPIVMLYYMGVQTKTGDGTFWAYSGIDGSGALRIRKYTWDPAERKPPNPHELLVREQATRRGLWKVMLWLTKNYTAELEVQDLGDSRVRVRLLNPPTAK